MTQRKWYYKQGTCYETFNILFDNSRFMLVQNDTTKTFSLGMSRDFNTLYGFPVNWSCLTKQEAISVLNGLISIDAKHEYNGVRELEKQQFGYTSIDQWNAMISALAAFDDGGKAVVA